MKTIKTMKQILFAIFFLLVASSALGKEGVNVKGDTIRIKTDHFLLEVATFDLKKNTLENAKIAEKLKTMLEALGNIEIQEPEADERIYIRYTGFIGGVKQDFKSLNLISEMAKKRSLIISNGEYLERDYGHVVLEIEDRNYTIRFYLEKMEDALSIDNEELTSKLSLSDPEIPKNRKKTNGWLIENMEGGFNSFFIGEVAPLTQDMLELNAGVGAGLIENQFVSGFNFRLGLAFGIKGIMKNKYFADYEVLYNFSENSGNFTSSTNGFLSFGFERNFSLDPYNAKWYGVSVGFLLDRNNSFFEENTFKIAVHKHINNSITLKPEIYFNDFFKNGSPGLRIQVAF